MLNRRRSLHVFLGAIVLLLLAVSVSWAPAATAQVMLKWDHVWLEK